MLTITAGSNWKRTFIRRILRCSLILLCFSLANCSAAREQTSAGNVRAVNHTTGAINWMSVNGYRVHGGGGRTCCVAMPTRWRPGITLDIEWEIDPNRFAKIKRLPPEKGFGFDDEAWAAHTARFRRYKKFVEVPEWPGTESCELNVHFFSCGRVEVSTHCLAIYHPDYPIQSGHREEEPDICPK